METTISVSVVVSTIYHSINISYRLLQVKSDQWKIKFVFACTFFSRKHTCRTIREHKRTVTKRTNATSRF